MNESNKSYALQTSLVILAVAFATLGCVLFQPVVGNVFSNTFTDLSSTSPATPEQIAKVWIDALFQANGELLRMTMCESQRAVMTDAMVESIASSLSGADTTINTDGITYSYNDSTNEVTLGGKLTITVQGQSLDVPMDSFPLGTLPMVQENGDWFVCLDLNEGMGQ